MHCKNPHTCAFFHNTIAIFLKFFWCTFRSIKNRENFRFLTELILLKYLEEDDRWGGWWENCKQLNLFLHIVANSKNRILFPSKYFLTINKFYLLSLLRFWIDFLHVTIVWYFNWVLLIITQLLKENKIDFEI